MSVHFLEEFPYTDAVTNVGLVISPTIESSYSDGTSIKLVVCSATVPTPVTFTCDGKSILRYDIYTDLHMCISCSEYRH
jgi:hypothetical protein